MCKAGSVLEGNLSNTEKFTSPSESVENNNYLCCIVTISYVLTFCDRMPIFSAKAFLLFQSYI